MPIMVLVERLKQAERDKGGEFFLGIPEAWWGGKTNSSRQCGCQNGHVSNMVLKTEQWGSVCLECHQRVVMIPYEAYTDETLKQELRKIAKETNYYENRPVHRYDPFGRPAGRGRSRRVRRERG
jgi:hypothetical protein